MIDLVFKNIPLALGFSCIGYSIGSLANGCYMESAVALSLTIICWLTYYRENRG